MGQTPKKKQLPKNIAALSDHDLMERIVGKKAMKSIDKMLADKSDDVENSAIFQCMKQE